MTEIFRSAHHSMPNIIIMISFMKNKKNRVSMSQKKIMSHEPKVTEWIERHTLSCGTCDTEWARGFSPSSPNVLGYHESETGLNPDTIQTGCIRCSKHHRPDSSPIRVSPLVPCSVWSIQLLSGAHDQKLRIRSLSV